MLEDLVDFAPCCLEGSRHRVEGLRAGKARILWIAHASDFERQGLHAISDGIACHLFENCMFRHSVLLIGMVIRQDQFSVWVEPTFSIARAALEAKLRTTK